MTTLAQLYLDIQAFTTYDDPNFIASFPTFTRATESRVFYFCQLPADRFAMTGSMTLGNPYLQLPTGFLAASSLSVDTGAEGWKFLLNKDVEYIREVYPVIATTGEPFAYAIFDANGATTIIIGPTPDADYDCQLNYFAMPQSLVDSPTGTWLSVNNYNCLLYGCLEEAANFMKRNGGIDNMGDTYAQRFLVEMQGLKNLGESRDRKDTYRSGEKRQPESV